MVIRVGSLRHDPRAEGFDAAPEGSRLCDAGEQTHLGTGQRIDPRQRTTLKGPHAHGATPGLEPGACQDTLANAPRIVLAERTVDHDHAIGPPKRSERLPQWPTRQTATVPETSYAVEGDQIDVAGHTVVLETVVQHQHVDPERRHRPQSHNRPVSPHQDGNTRSVRGEKQGLVAHLVDASSHEATIRDDSNRLAPSPAVTAAGESHPIAAPPELRSDPGSDRGLPGTAHHEVTDAYHATGETRGAPQPGGEEPAMQPGDQRIEPGRHDQRSQR
jgi:hypothetical protein